MKWCYRPCQPPLPADPSHGSWKQFGAETLHLMLLDIQSTYKDGTARPGHKKTAHSIPKFMNI